MLKRGSGAFVRKPGLKIVRKNIKRLILLNEIDLDEFFKARLPLEKKACYEAALYIKNDELATLEDTINRMKSTVTPSEWSKYEYQFHNTIAKAANSKLIYIFLNAISGAMQSYFEQSFTMPHHFAAVPSHTKILSALREHDAVLAEKHMGDHLEWSYNWIMGIQKSEDGFANRQALGRNAL